MIDKEAEAQRLRRNYHRRLERLRIKSTYHGDRAASVKIITVLTEYYTKLKELGYRTTDENEPGRPGRVVPITQQWRDEQEAKKTPMDRLAEKARNGDMAARREYILALAKGE